VTLEAFAAHKSLDVDFLRNCGLADGYSNDWKVPAVRIAYYGEDGTQLDPRYRIASGSKDRADGRKTVSPKGGKTALYGLHRRDEVLERGFVILVEGESDTLTLWHHDWPAIGLPGAGNFKDERDVAWFDGVGTIYMVREPDQGGETMTKKIARSAIAARVRVMDLLPYKDVSELHLADPGGFDAILRAAMEAAVPLESISPPPTTALTTTTGNLEQGRPRHEGHPTISVGGGNLPFNIDEAEQELIDAALPIFQYGDRLVRVARGPIIAAEGHRSIEIMGERTIELTIPYLRAVLSRIIDFRKYDARSKEDHSVNCPPDIAEGILHRTGEWNLPVLTGIVATPVIRPDDTIIDQAGYDQATGLYLAPGQAVFPSIDPNPSREDALQALADLAHPLRDFPFADDASKSVALSAILTGLDRPMLDRAPAHAVDAPQAGSGKGLLCNYAAIICTGHEAAAVVASDDPKETDKAVAAKLMEGHTIINLDNVEHPLGSALLAQMMTQGVLDLRVLGQSRIISVPNHALVLVNGNNLALLGDLPRRFLKCRLDPKVDRPEQRVFKSENPLHVARRDRAKLVAAGLTVLLAYRRAGCPGPDQADDARPLGGFEQWNQRIRNLFLWLKQADPVATQEAIRSVNRRLNAHVALMTAWLDAAPATSDQAAGQKTIPMTARRLAEMAEEMTRVNNSDEVTYALKRPVLREALMEIAAGRSGRDIDTTRLGNFLGRRVDEAAGGMRIEKDDTGGHGGAALWRVSRLPA
jgi:putative DNA primase/helicase